MYLVLQRLSDKKNSLCIFNVKNTNACHNPLRAMSKYIKQKSWK